MDPTPSPSPLFGPLVSPVLADDERSSPQSDRPPTKESLAPSLPVVSELPRTYICPGEKHAIPRSIHLARLAAFYPNCRLCEHRTDTGQLPRSMVGRIEQTVQRVERASPFRNDGVRGVYLNQLTRKTAGQIAAAVAEQLWSEQPLVGRTRPVDDDEAPKSVRHRVGPTVVIGQDARTSSPDLSVGVSESLRRMGCEVVDIGQVSQPCLAFSVDHLQAHGGLLVTGSGCPEAWTGIDVVGAAGVPWSMHGTLAEVEQRFTRGVSRPTRRGGSQKYFDATVPYRASLLKHYQETRPQRLVCLCGEPTVIDTLRPLLDSLSCEFVWPESTSGHGTAGNGSDPIVAAMRNVVRKESADGGVAISDDGTAVRWFDNKGRPVPEPEVLRRIIAALGSLREILIGQDVNDDSRAMLTSSGWPTADVDAGSEQMARQMQERTAIIGVQAGGRVWFRDSVPRCDAAITLGHLLQTPRSDE